MEGLESKVLYKIMWLPDTLEVIWDMKNEYQISQNSPLYSILDERIKLVEWVESYSNLYKDWLDSKSNRVYDINDTINQQMILAIRKCNEELDKEKLFFWFDYDRTETDERWEKSPVSDNNLHLLGNEYHYLNQLVSIEDTLVFPNYPR